LQEPVIASEAIQIWDWEGLDCFVAYAPRNDGKLLALSFRDGPKDQARYLGIPGSMLRIAPE